MRCQEEEGVKKAGPRPKERRNALRGTLRHFKMVTIKKKNKDCIFL